MVRLGRGYPNPVRESHTAFPIFDAVGASKAGAGASGSWLHTINGSAVLIGASSYGTASVPSWSCTVGGVNAPLLGQSYNYWNDGGTPPANYAAMALFGLRNPPKGSQTVVVSEPSTANIAGNSVSYKNLNKFLVVTQNISQIGASVFSLAASGTLNQLLVCCMGDVLSTFGTITGSPVAANQRFNIPGAGGVNLAVAMADSLLNGAVTETFNSTMSAAINCGGVLVLCSY